MLDCSRSVVSSAYRRTIVVPSSYRPLTRQSLQQIGKSDCQNIALPLCLVTEAKSASGRDPNKHVSITKRHLMFFTTTLTCCEGQCIEHFEGDVEEVKTRETVYDEMRLTRVKQSPLMSTMNLLQIESFAPSNESARRTEVSSRLRAKPRVCQEEMRSTNNWIQHGAEVRCHSPSFFTNEPWLRNTSGNVSTCKHVSLLLFNNSR